MSILIVEDEIMVALFLEDLLAEAGFTVAGVASRLEEAMVLAEAPCFTAAVLDVHLDGKDVFPLADPERHAGRPVLQKPFRPEELTRTLAALTAAA